MLNRIINNVTECEVLAKKIAKKIQVGYIISLEGELGTGRGLVDWSEGGKRLRPLNGILFMIGSRVIGRL